MKEVDVRVEPKQHEGDCPRLFTFAARVKVAGRGDLTYQWQRSDLAVAPVETLAVPRSGTYELETTWALGGISATTYDEWQKLVVLTPTRVESEPAAFHLTCRERPPDLPPVPLGAPPIVVRAVELRAEPADYEGPCPATITFRASIEVEGGPGPLTYRFLRSDGAKGEARVLNVVRPGSKTVTETWTLGRQPEPVFEGWQQLMVLTPEPMTSAAATFSVTCRP